MARNKSDPAGGSSQKANQEDYEAEPLNEADRHRFLSILDPDPVKAGERYELIRQKLIRYFGRRGHPDAEDLADETLARAYYIMCDFDKFIFGIARNVKREDRRKQEKEGPAIDVSEVELSSPDNPDYLEIEHLKQCLQKLSSWERALIIVYTTSDQHGREDLAKQWRMPMSTLRSRVAKIRKKLRKCAKDGSGNM